MKTISIEVEIENDEDAIEVMNLLHEHNFTSRISENFDEEDERDEPLSEEQLFARLEEAENSGSMTFDEFKQKLAAWK